MKPTSTAPTSHELHQLSGTFFYDEQNSVQAINRIHVMHTHYVGWWNFGDGGLAPNHVSTSACWCSPELAGEDENGIEVWMHNARA